MILFGANQISKSFTDKPLFRGLSFSIDSGERVGLIGPNGAGKSTLMKIIAGRESVDSGRTSFSKGLRVGFLEQNPQFKGGATLQETVMEGATDIYDWEQIARAQELSSKMGLNQFPEDTLITALSGGWKKRVALARELMKDPELLLMDEPTNHLDVEGILWLEDYLEDSSIATLTITHDRLFLQKIANRIIEIDRRHPEGMISINGTYADFLDAREQLMSAQESMETKLRNTLRRETEWLRRGAKARQTKQKARIEATHKLGEVVDDLGSRNTERVVRFDFHAAEKNPKKLVEAKGISKSYDGRLIIPVTDMLIGPKSRIGLMGTNGCGKSTLIKMLTKEIEPDTGSVFHAEKLDVAYFEQNRDSLDQQKSVFKNICPQGDHVEYAGTMVHARGYLARFLFDSDKMEQPVYRLSGGEQSRLLLAKLMLTKANVLVLDEPTNDLDMATLDILAQVLQDFNGAIILVTHDRYFLDQLTNLIVAFGVNEEGERILVPMVGLDQWQVWHADQMELQELLKSEALSEKREVSAPATAIQPAVKKKNEKKLAQLEAAIEKAEAELKSVQDEIAAYQGRDSKKLQELNGKLNAKQAVVDQLVEEWST